MVIPTWILIIQLCPLYSVPLWSISQTRWCPLHTLFLHNKMFMEDGTCCRRSSAESVLYLISDDSCLVLDQVPHSFNVLNCSSSDRSASMGLILKARFSLLWFNFVKRQLTEVVWTCLPFIRSGLNYLARHSERGKKTRQTESKRSGKTTLRNGQAWSSLSPKGQWRIEKNGENWLWSHLWCPNYPHG